MSSTALLLSVARRLHREPRAKHSLRSLALRAGLSPDHLQREFVRVAGESPLRYSRRVRLWLALTELLGNDADVRRVASDAGFGSAEALIRHFRAEFGCTPERFRRRHRSARSAAGFAGGLRLAARLAPCARFFHVSTEHRRFPMPLLSTSLRVLAAQPALVIRSRVPRSAIAQTIGANLGRIVPYALGAGGVFTGQPFARYPDFGPGNVTIEVGMPLATPLAGQGDIEAYTLPAGETAVGVHGGTYESMPESYAAMERWMASEGKTPSGAPWEVYVSDPAEHPNPADWRTEICWPVR
ncbi:MAG: AraC family transcriptional regulator [Steroidobacteraceae bacterium]